VNYSPVFVPLIAAAIRTDCLRRLCLEFWEAFVDGMPDEGTLRAHRRALPEAPAGGPGGGGAGAYEAGFRQGADNPETANLDAFVCEAEPKDRFQGKLASTRDAGWWEQLHLLSRQLKPASQAFRELLVAQVHAIMRANRSCAAGVQDPNRLFGRV
jgi:hypothetical protein